MKEVDIVRQILEYLRLIGAHAGKTKTTGVFDPKRRCFRVDPWLFRGFPDLTAFHKGKMFFIEVKSATGSQSNEQVLFSVLCAEAGIPYILARDVEDVSKVIS
jgi:hypothetical protein